MTATTASLIGLALSILTAAWKICEKLTSNTDALKAHTDLHAKLDADNAKDHTEMWDKIEEHDDAIGDHETRLQLLEHKEE